MAQHEVNKSLFSPTTTTNPLNDTLPDSSYHQQWPGTIAHTPRVPPNGLQVRLVLPSDVQPLRKNPMIVGSFMDGMDGDWYYKPLTAEILYDVDDGICNLDHIFQNSLLLKVTASSPEFRHTPPPTNEQQQSPMLPSQTPPAPNAKCHHSSGSRSGHTCRQ
ncbi:hypothetical protein B0H14DRAFT_2599169 [Mycena olivaceomarginata]|nr:hypothetical protein B0H14DRAFT_2599169 [Mycena olivaceomarginata]